MGLEPLGSLEETGECSCLYANTVTQYNGLKDHLYYKVVEKHGCRRSNVPSLMETWMCSTVLAMPIFVPTPIPLIHSTGL